MYHHQIHTLWVLSFLFPFPLLHPFKPRPRSPPSDLGSSCGVRRRRLTTSPGRGTPCPLLHRILTRFYFDGCPEEFCGGSLTFDVSKPKGQLIPCDPGNQLTTRPVIKPVRRKSFYLTFRLQRVTLHINVSTGTRIKIYLSKVTFLRKTSFSSSCHHTTFDSTLEHRREWNIARPNSTRKGSCHLFTVKRTLSSLLFTSKGPASLLVKRNNLFKLSVSPEKSTPDSFSKETSLYLNQPSGVTNPWTETLVCPVPT